MGRIADWCEARREAPGGLTRRQRRPRLSVAEVGPPAACRLASGIVDVVNRDGETRTRRGGRRLPAPGTTPRT